jgi:hypothetical protein
MPRRPARTIEKTTGEEQRYTIDWDAPADGAAMTPRSV